MAVASDSAGADRKVKTHAVAKSSRDGKNYYEVLDVQFEASEEDIRKRYHVIVRTLHPDRRRPGAGSIGDKEALERFHQVQSAWRCLSDPTRRLLYDLRSFGKSSTSAGITVGPDAEVKLLQMQKEQATCDIVNMQDALNKILGRERAARGIIIRNAIYGNLRLREDRLAQCVAGSRTIEPEDLVGPYCTVTVPLQCLVEQHTLILPGGVYSSKSDLPGFYHPAPMSPDLELSLYALYEFRGQVHEVMVGDRETLSMPFRRHAVPKGELPRGPFSSANVTLLRKDEHSRSKAVPNAGGQIAGSSGMQDSLNKAVLAYRFEWLSQRGPDESTPREFVAVASLTGFALALATWWAMSGSDIKRII